MTFAPGDLVTLPTGTRGVVVSANEVFVLVVAASDSGDRVDTAAKAYRVEDVRR